MARAASGPRIGIPGAIARRLFATLSLLAVGPELHVAAVIARAAEQARLRRDLASSDWAALVRQRSERW